MPSCIFPPVPRPGRRLNRAEDKVARQLKRVFQARAKLCKDHPRQALACRRPIIHDRIVDCIKAARDSSDYLAAFRYDCDYAARFGTETEQQKAKDNLARAESIHARTVNSAALRLDSMKFRLHHRKRSFRIAIKTV